MTSASYYLSGNTYSAFSSFGLTNTPYRLDFTLAGRIQDRATFYFAYENITGHNYYSIPYYPIPIGGIKIGIAWDFIN
ncbi:MAG: hypothetical protein KDC90_09440, partial [Ignavibacteriae bacterium]|nr:hypothetical protein [Ignavibacteriota bacterium]